MIIVTLVFALMASVVTPRLFAMQRGEQRRKFEADLSVLVTDASVRAKQSGQTLTMRFDESESRFVIAVAETDPSAEPAATGRGVSLYDEYSIDQLRIANEGFTAADWQVEFYADGSSTGGGIQFSEGEGSRCIEINNGTSQARWGNGDLPDASLQKWVAGEREIRQ